MYNSIPNSVIIMYFKYMIKNKNELKYVKYNKII